MKFETKYTETFLRNILKHKLNQYEFKVLLAFIIDHPTKFTITLTELKKRTGILKPNISRSLRGLVFQGILFQDEKDDDKYKINPLIIDTNYLPLQISSSPLRKEEESKNVPGNGNFKNKAKIKRDKAIIADNNIRKMIKEASEKRGKSLEWKVYFSDYSQEELFVKITQTDNGFITYFTEDPNNGRIRIAPATIVEEFCSKALGIKNPEEMLPYLDSRDSDSFILKYGLKIRS